MLFLTNLVTLSSPNPEVETDEITKAGSEPEHMSTIPFSKLSTWELLVSQAESSRQFPEPSYSSQGTTRYANGPTLEHPRSRSLYVDGEVVGCDVVGETDGDPVGDTVGSDVVGDNDGDTVGDVVGSDLVGDSVGSDVVGDSDGENVGDSVGSDVVGDSVGDVVGSEVVGARVGEMLGLVVGLSVCAVTYANWDVYVVPLTENDTGDEAIAAAASRAACMLTLLPCKRSMVANIDPANTSHCVTRTHVAQ